MLRTKYFYLDSDLKKVPPSHFKEAQTATDSDTYQSGDVVEAWDHVFRWTKECVPLSKWEEWRGLGDAYTDVALPIVMGPAGDDGGTDLLSRLETAATQTNPDPAVQKLWLHLNSGPEQALWPNKEQILRGQAVFYRYAPQILASLLHFSLSSGFSSPRVSRILNIASYIVPPMESTPEGDTPRISKESNDRSFQRLMETTQWMINCMGDGAMEPGGIGWSSTVRVRLLHTLMRRRILEKSKNEWETKGFSVYNEKEEGIPISQEDMVSTLNSFTSAPLFCMEKTGLSPLPQECEDWTALWRVIGYYFGELVYGPTSFEPFG
jgi:ER-bound oxygenase mpaB/B'/Rubber oxygenase, catalytic domain